MPAPSGAADDRGSSADAENLDKPVDPLELDPSLLEQTMEATLQAAEDAPMTERELGALRDAARLRENDGAPLEVRATELIQALLLVNYGRLRRDEDFWRDMAAKISAVLCESPSSAARLENLWRRLIESDK